MEVLIPLVLLFVVFWFFVVLPQRRTRRTHAEMQDALVVGDQIITAGGMHGTITAVEETIVSVEIAAGTGVRVDRRAVAARVDELDDLEQEATRIGSANDGNPG